YGPASGSLEACGTMPADASPPESPLRPRRFGTYFARSGAGGKLIRRARPGRVWAGVGARSPRAIGPRAAPVGGESRTRQMREDRLAGGDPRGNAPAQG